MKKVLLASAAALVAATPALAADTDSDSFNVNASVAQACTMENIGDIDLGDLPINLNAGSGALQLVGNTSGAAGSFWVSCNDTNSMTVASANGGRLVNQDRTFDPASDDPTFSDRIRYRLFANNYQNSGGQPGFIGGTAQNQGVSRGAIHRQIDMTASVLAVSNNTIRPLAGNYSDAVTVTVTTL
jgi:spore coat protein U-like protein